MPVDSHVAGGRPASRGRPTPSNSAPRSPGARTGLALGMVVAGLAVACASRPRRVEEPAGATVSPSRLPATFDAFLTARAGDHLRILALSGGGQNGAFGAGVLAGWRESGRPTFDVVTGISTGALQATHAFLGTPADDRAIGRAYTDSSSRDILCPRTPIAVVFGESLDDFTPLRGFLDRLLDDATIDRVAAATAGRRRLLLVGTTNLDSGRLAVWDLGALARERAYVRYRDVVFASASPPIVAAPVFLDGAMHTDGSVISQVFVPNPEQNLSASRLAEYRALAERRSPGLGTRVSVDVIVNGLLHNRPRRVTNGSIPIGRRAAEIWLTSAEIGSLWYVHGLATLRNGTFRLLSIPETLRAEADDALAFDTASMRTLHAAGLELGRSRASWAETPPPIEED